MALGSWAPFKELSNIVNVAVVLKQQDAYFSLEKTLKKHKPDFIALLKNPPKNQAHRTLVQGATKQGLKVSAVPHPLTLPQEFIDEALILSDILNLNEIASVELLLAGEQHQPDFPSLTRGLVAVLLYYDGKRNLVTSLRSLIQAREGVSWTLGIGSNVVSLVTNFTDDLMQNGLVDTILKQVYDINTDKELENLSKGRAINDAKHKQQIIDLIEETKHALMDSLFYLSCQSPFSKDNMTKILTQLKKIPATNEGHQPLDYTSLALFFTLVASFKVSDSTHDPDVSLLDEHFPLITDASFLTSLHQAILKDDWSNSALEAAVKFTWAVLLRECTAFDAFSEQDELEEDENLVDESIEKEAFQFLRQAVIASPFFHNEEYYVRRLHHLLTTYIVLMPVKITELRNHGDEVAREEFMRTVRGAPPSAKSRQDFGELMKMVGDLYFDDPNGLNLSLEYWASVHSISNTGITPRVPHRQLSLFKFIHQCCDLLPPSLFSPFMSMFVGLSNSPLTASHSFNFLKSNSPSLGGGGPSASISLDHFFSSLRQYYFGLRKEMGAKHTPTGCAISPQELDGLLMVLKLIRTIATLDENARVVMYENQSWLPVASLFGLIGCPIPRPLKSEIFITLSAFARSPEIAASMWHTLESSQVLNTTPNVVSGSGAQYGLVPTGQEGSIQIELEEIESKSGDYPETRAFLSLLDAMTDVTVPPSLGLGYRVPGFQPYLEFVRDSVFLKFDSRAYKDPQEKWLVASGAMEIMYKLLSTHDIVQNDFIEQTCEIAQGRVITLPCQPGHSIIHHLLNDSALLRKLLFIVDECCQLLSDVDSSTDKVAHAGLLALKLLESTLNKQESFLSILRESPTHSIMATPLNDLLLGINPRSRKADHYINIAKYVTFNICSPELASTAVRILCLASHSVAVAKDILNSVTSSQDTHINILHGFVEHLEWDDTFSEPHPQNDDLSTQEETSEDIQQESPFEIRRQLKVDILRLLITCIKCPTINIGHFLLGYIQSPFDRNKKMSEATLQDPGVLGSLKTCLHAVLSLIHIGGDPNISIGCHYTHPKLAESCYHLIYLLCGNKELSVTTLRYLRNNHDFFYTQLSHLPFQWTREIEEGSDPSEVTLSLKQQAWLLCTIALELRMTGLKNQRSHMQRLIMLLLRSITTLTDQYTEVDQSTYQITEWSTGGKLLFETSTEPSLMQDGRRKILTLLDLICFSSLPLPQLQLQHFDATRTEEVISSCEMREEGSGPVYVNIKMLHRLLVNELNSLQGAAAVSQKQFIMKEIHDVLRTVVERNRAHEIMSSQQLLMDSWCKVVEVMVGVVNEEVGKEEVKVAVLFELIQDLLLKVENVDANSLTASAHSVVFTLMAHLRQTLSNQFNESEHSRSLAPLSSGPLQSILRGLLNNLLRCPSGMQRLRAHLYATLLCYLQTTREKQEHKFGLWRLEQDSGLAAANLSVLSECGEGLMDVVCRDACNGHDVAKMLALSLLDAIITLDRHNVWLHYMTVRGYLQKVCASLQWDDETLQKMLHPQPDILRPLYIYESKMAFLIRVASSPMGARDLVAMNCLAHLNECRFIDLRPGNHGNKAIGSSQGTAGFIPSTTIRYLQLLLPVLRFVLTLMTTSGPQQKEASSQVLLFIYSHMEVFSAILKESLVSVTMATLQELSLLTAVISQCRAGQDWLVNLQLPHTAGLLRIQHRLLSLLPYYLTPTNWKEIAQEVTKLEEGWRGSVNGPVWEEVYSLSQNVCSSLLAYCQNAMTAGGTEFSVNFNRILFTPDISGAVVSNTQMSSLSPSLGMLISSLKEVCDGYFVAIETMQQLQKKLDGLQNMTSEEMKQLIPDVSDRNTLSLVQLQNMSKLSLQRLLEGKKRQISQFIYILEHMLCLLWRHLQFYLVYCKPTGLGANLEDTGLIMRPAMRKLHETGTGTESSSKEGDINKFDLSQLSEGITLNDLEQLKLGLDKCLSDSLFKKLLDISDVLSQTKEDSTIGFIHALVRRIKKLLKLRAAAKPILHL